jgi:hypothetical protein
MLIGAEPASDVLRHRPTATAGATGGMAAGRELDIDLPRSWVIGARLSDLQAVLVCQTVLLRTGEGETTGKLLVGDGLNRTGIAANIKEAVNWLLAGSRPERATASEGGSLAG